MKVYPKSSYDSARNDASRLLANASVFEEVQRRIDEKTMKADEVLARLAEHARGDMGDFLGVNNEPLLEGTKTRLIKKLKIKTTTRTIADIDTITKEVDLELYDAQSALDKIGRHHKLFTDKTEITGRDGEELFTPILIIQESLLDAI